MVVSAAHFAEVTNGYEQQSDGLWTHRGRAEFGFTRVTNSLPSARGAGVETGFLPSGATSLGYIQSLDRDAGLYRDLQLIGKNVSLAPQQGGSVTMPAGSIGTAALAANAVTQVFAAVVASGFQTTTNNWVETNITGTWTFTGVQCRIDQTFIFYHSAASAGIYLGWMLDGVVQAATGYLNMPVAGQTQTAHSVWFATIPSGAHRVSLCVYSATAGTLTFNAAAYSLVAVTEFRR